MKRITALLMAAMVVLVPAVLAQNALQTYPTASVPNYDDWLYLSGTTFSIRKLSPLYFDPMTTTGDLIYQGASGAPARLPVGSNGQVLTLSGGVPVWSSSSGSGTVTNFSAGNLSPFFTTSVATSTSTPALTFNLSNAGANTILGNNSGSSAAPAYSLASTYADAITGLGTTGIVKRTGSNTYAIATAGTDYQAAGNYITALTGDVTASGPGSVAATVARVNGVTYGTSPGTNTVPVVTGSGATTYEAVPNAALANSSITIAGNSTSLGGSVTQDQITGLSSTGLLKRTGSNTLAIATAGTDYLTGNQTITLTGDTTGSGATSIATTTKALNGTLLSGLATGLLKNTTSTGVPTIAVSGTDYAPATTATGVIYGNGSGGFSYVASGSNTQVLTLVGGVPTWSASSGGGTTTNALTGNNSNTGAASGSTFNGSSAVTWSANTFGAGCLANANTWTAKNTFSPTATVAGVNVGTYAGNPSSLVNGDIWYNSSAQQFNVYTNSGIVTIATAGGGTTTNSLTVNSSGSGGSSPQTFNGSSAVTISYNTVGASPASGPSAGQTVAVTVSSSTSYTIPSTDFNDVFTGTSNGSWAMPASPSSGQVYRIKNQTATAGVTVTLTSTANFFTNSSGSTLVLNQGDCADLVYANSTWQVE